MVAPAPRLEGRVVLVTGGSHGIGRSIAHACAAEGASLALVARTPAPLEEAAAEVRAIGVPCLTVCADVSRAPDAARMVEETEGGLGPVDVLVHAAGVYGPIGPITETDPEAWAQAIAINLVGAYLCTRAVLPGMMARRRGKVVHFSGGGASEGRANFSAYSASKTAVVRFAETAALEVAPYNVQVNVIAPGAVRTRLHEDVVRAGIAAGPDEVAKAQRLLESAEADGAQAVELALLLASEASGALTGRLISAPWDDWHALPALADSLSEDVYRLRRVTPDGG